MNKSNYLLSGLGLVLSIILIAGVFTPWIKYTSGTGSLSTEHGNATGWAITQGDITFKDADIFQTQSPLPLFTFFGGILAFIGCLLSIPSSRKITGVLVVIGGLLATIGAWWALGGVTSYSMGGIQSISVSTGAIVCLIAGFLTFVIGLYKFGEKGRQKKETEGPEEEVKIGKKTATPLLYVNEFKPMEERLMWGFIWGSVLFVIGLLSALMGRHAYNRDYFSSFEIFELFVFPLWGIIYGVVRRNRYYLCVEGVGFPGRWGRLYEWSLFNDFTIDDNKKQFILKRPKGTLKLTTMKHFDEAKEILSQFIHPKE